MAKWVVDIGNTKTAFAKAEGGKVSSRIDIVTSQLESSSLLISSEDEVLIASVVPKATQVLVERCTHLGIRHRVITARDIPLQNRYEEIDNLGSDRILAAFASHTHFGKPAGRDVIVVSLGTATTFECVSKEGVYLGGAITLGIGSIIDAVHERTAQLPKVPMEVPKSAIGRTTISALQSGILNTQLLGIKAFTHTLALEAFPGEEPLLIATGGLAAFTNTHLAIFHHVEPDLVLTGLALL